MKIVLVSFLLISACSGSDGKSSDDTDQPGSGTGTLAARFTIDEDWRAAMEEPATGPFRGSVYLADEVSGVGPDAGAEALGDVFVENVDLSAGGTTDVLWTSEALPVGWVTILGFMDSDANAVEGEEDPDEKDPVTLPHENEFEVLEDAETEITIQFGFLNP